MFGKAIGSKELPLLSLFHRIFDPRVVQQYRRGIKSMWESFLTRIKRVKSVAQKIWADAVWKISYLVAFMTPFFLRNLNNVSTWENIFLLYLPIYFMIAWSCSYNWTFFAAWELLGHPILGWCAWYSSLEWNHFIFRSCFEESSFRCKNNFNFSKKI